MKKYNLECGPYQFGPDEISVADQDISNPSVRKLPYILKAFHIEAKGKTAELLNHHMR